MSRSAQNDTTVNPAKRFFEWSGSEGKLTYFDKNVGEKGEKVDVPMPFTFLLLDNLLTIKGFDQNSGSGIWSNEISQKDAKVSVLTVKNKHGEIAKGTYENIKEKVKGLGGKYAQSCYIAYFEGKELVIGNITFSGSSFSGGKHKDASKKEVEVNAWLGFSKESGRAIFEKAITMVKDERMCTNGATKFYCPSFSLRETSPETDENAKELDKQLQEYLKEYFIKQNTPETNKVDNSFDQSPKQEDFNQDRNDPFAPKQPTNAYATSAPAPTPQGNYANNGAVG